MSHRTIDMALALYDERRMMGTSEHNALASTAAGLAVELGVPRARARDVLVAALKIRNVHIPNQTVTL